MASGPAYHGRFSERNVRMAVHLSDLLRTDILLAREEKLAL